MYVESAVVEKEPITIDLPVGFANGPIFPGRSALPVVASMSPAALGSILCACGGSTEDLLEAVARRIRARFLGRGARSSGLPRAQPQEPENRSPPTAETASRAPARLTDIRCLYLEVDAHLPRGSPGARHPGA